MPSLEDCCFPQPAICRTVSKAPSLQFTSVLKSSVMTDLTPRPDAIPPLVPGRSCEGCTTCCKLAAVAELKKPMQVWCEHCSIGKGCNIYEARPADCRTFYCGWVLDPSISDQWDPRHSNMAIKFEANRILILVDKDRKDAWRKEPFNRQIRQWAAQAVARHGEVLVWEGLEALRVLPTGEQRLGR